MVPTNASTSVPNLDLVCLEGPLENQRFKLAPDAPMMVGRTKRGLHLPDPLVSIEHAEISWTTDRYYVTDLGSLTGTFVDGKRLGKEPVALLPGMKLTIGESTFLIEVRHERPPWFWAGVGLLGLVGLGGVVLGAGALVPYEYTPALVAPSAVHQIGETSPIIRIPLSFVRLYGVDGRSASVARVSDFDHDGVDELWIDTATRRYVVTFANAAAGTQALFLDPGATVGWKLIGELPLGCYDGSPSPFPEERCGGEIYAHDGEKYVLVGQDGIVAWIASQPPPPAAGEPAPRPGPTTPSPFRIVLVDDSKLAGFLADRGIFEPIQYLVCEEAVPGIRAQVLTAAGEIKPLAYGCIHAMELSGSSPSERFGGNVPAAVAFTGAGRKALLDDLTTYLGGAPDGLFLNDVDAATMRTFSGEPQPRVMLQLSFDGPQGPFRPVASETFDTGVRYLQGNGRVPNYPAPHATTVLAQGVGSVEIDPPGCSKLEVTTRDWSCVLAKLCWPTNPFLEISNVGCGDPHPLVVAPYGAPFAAGGDGNVEVRVADDVATGNRVLDVLRARVSYRTLDTESSSTPSP